MADKEKRSLREFLRHINDYTYRFNPEKGQFRYRELRGVRDTAFDFYMWLKCWKDMVAFVAKCPVSAVRALFRYQWFATYLTYPNFVDRGTLGMRGNQLRMARAQYDRIVKKATDLLRISFVADEHFHPGNEMSKKVVLFDELVPGEIMAGFPNLIYLPAQVLPVFLCSILDQQITPPYLDAAENFGIPADVCPLPSAEAGCALRDEYPKVGTCFVACNMPCDGSVATTSYQDRYFNLPTYYFGVPIRYNEEAVQDYAVEELRGLIRFIEEQTGVPFDYQQLCKKLESQNELQRFEWEKWDVAANTNYYPINGVSQALYRIYQSQYGDLPIWHETDKKVRKIMEKCVEQRINNFPLTRHRVIAWSCAPLYYSNWCTWAYNCWGLNTVMNMDSLMFDMTLRTDGYEHTLEDMATYHEWAPMRRMAVGGMHHIFELWENMERFHCDMVMMYDQLLCKGMQGVHGLFEDEFRARNIHAIWMPHALPDKRNVSRAEIRSIINDYMTTVMQEEPLDPSLLEFDDSMSW